MEPTSPRVGLVAESIDGPGVRVRRYRDDDLAAVRAGCDDPLTQRFLPLLPSPYTHEDALWWITEGAGAAFEAGGANYAIADPLSDRLLGGIGITHHRDGNGEIGYWVAPWARRRGTATAATGALSGYAFAAGFERLQLRTEPENSASQRVAIGAGYRREGVQRGAGASRDGGRHDLIVWARLAGDPPGPTRRLLPDLPGDRLVDGPVTLTPLGARDAADAYALRTAPDVWPVVAPGTVAPPTRADVERICARAAAEWLAGTAARLAVRDTAGGGYVGEVVLHHRYPELGAGALTVAVAPQRRGGGAATRAVRLLAGWALGGAGLARLVADTPQQHPAGQRVLLKAGFTREGYQRGHRPEPGGGRADVLRYALLATDLPGATPAD